MKIKLVTIAKTDQAYLREGIQVYLNRLKHYISFEYIELSDKKISKKMSEAQQKEKEGDLILEQVQAGDELFLFDENGKMYSSVNFAAFLEKKMIAATKRIVVVIGGPYGFSQTVKARATGKISLSPMTFSHQMVRLIAVEQFYRAMTILKGEPYHHQ